MKTECPKCGKKEPASYENNGLVVVFCDNCGAKPAVDPNNEFDADVYEVENHE